MCEDWKARALKAESEAKRLREGVDADRLELIDRACMAEGAEGRVRNVNSWARNNLRILSAMLADRIDGELSGPIPTTYLKKEVDRILAGLREAP